MNNPLNKFALEKIESVRLMGGDPSLSQLGFDFIAKTAPYRYSYNFSWMGVPAIQFPQDMVAMQEIIFELRPDLIIETGVAHGGSLIFYASILELIGKGRVVGVDIDIREHNRKVIDSHSMRRRIDLVEGSSVSEPVVQMVSTLAKGCEVILVCLDSNHSHDHVLRELELYGPFVTKGSYMVVFDTVVEYLPPSICEGRPWGPGNSPLTALQEFVRHHPQFSVDDSISNKLLISAAPSGFLKRVE